MWVEGEIVTDQIPGTGTVRIAIKESSGLSGPSFLTTYWDYFEVIPIINSRVVEGSDLSEVLDSKNLTDPEEVIIYHGDSDNTLTGAELYMGGYETIGGAATDAWQSLRGTTVDQIQQLCADVYKAQHTSTAERLQSTIRGQLTYLSILQNLGKSYLPGSMTYLVDDSEWQGERIEMKTIWTQLAATFANGPTPDTRYDTFSTIVPNQVGIEKTQSSTPAQGLVTVTTEIGQRYKLVIEVLSPIGTIPDFTFCGVTKTDFVEGVNTWELVALSVQGVSDVFFENAPLELIQALIQIAIYKSTGG
jgi:hypothetical protein